jgi:hypothetical protein
MSNQYNRIRLSVPAYASPYNMPLKPQMYRPPCSVAPPGAIFTTDHGTYGSCSSGPNKPNPGMPPWDFICPRGRTCVSQTGPMVGMTPDSICCGANVFQATVSGPVQEVQSIWGPLPVNIWTQYKNGFMYQAAPN